MGPGGASAVFFCCLVTLVAVDVSLAVKFDGQIRDVGGGRYDAYMIPPYPSNHASFLELIPQSHILVMAWFSGTGEGQDKCSIVAAHLLANSTQWSNATLVSQREGYSNQNPVLFYDTQTGTLNLFHTQQKADLSDGSERVASGTKEETAHIWRCQSTDQIGVNWSSPKEIFDKDGSFDRNRIIKSVTNDGLIFPIYYSVEGDKNQYSAMKLSADHITWKEFKVDKSNYLVQPSVVRPVPDRQYIKAFFRDRRAEHIYTSSSNDEGESWVEPKKTVLPNNNAAIQATMLASRNMAIVFNPLTKGRNVIAIAVSKDGGFTWPHMRDLEHTTVGMGGGVEKSVEYSYPSILQTADGFIHVSYTYNRDTIKYVKFKEDWVYTK